MPEHRCTRIASGGKKQAHLLFWIGDRFIFLLSGKDECIPNKSRKLPKNKLKKSSLSWLLFHCRWKAYRFDSHAHVGGEREVIRVFSTCSSLFTIPFQMQTQSWFFSVRCSCWFSAVFLEYVNLRWHVKRWFKDLFEWYTRTVNHSSLRYNSLCLHSFFFLVRVVHVWIDGDSMWQLRRVIKAKFKRQQKLPYQSELRKQIKSSMTNIALINTFEEAEKSLFLCIVFIVFVIRLVPTVIKINIQQQHLLGAKSVNQPSKCNLNYALIQM